MQFGGMDYKLCGFEAGAFKSCRQAEDAWVTFPHASSEVQTSHLQYTMRAVFNI